MLKMAVMVSVLPIPIKSRQLQKATTSQTAFTGVCVKRLTLLQNLFLVSSHRGFNSSGPLLTRKMGRRRRERKPMPFARSLASRSNR